MFQKIKNMVYVNVEGTELTTLTKLEFYVRQGPLNFQYVPTVINDSEMVVEVPKADADKLKFEEPVTLQFCGTAPNGFPVTCEPVKKRVNEFLKPEGYDGN